MTTRKINRNDIDLLQSDLIDDETKSTLIFILTENDYMYHRIRTLNDGISEILDNIDAFLKSNDMAPVEITVLLDKIRAKLCDLNTR